jgi:hypothetical protein
MGVMGITNHKSQGAGKTKSSVTQGDIKRFLRFFCAVCFPVFWRRRPDARRKKKTQPERRKTKSLWREGPPKKKSTDPPVHLLNLRPTHPPPDFFFLDLFFSTFLGVSRQGEFKNTIKIFWQKSVSKTSPKISKKKSMSVFPRLFLFYRIFGCFSAMGVQKH